MTKYDGYNSNDHIIVLVGYTSGTHELNVIVQPKNDYRPEVEFTFSVDGEREGIIRFFPEKMTAEFYAACPARVESLMEVLTRIEDYKGPLARTIEGCLMRAHKAMRSGEDKETGDLVGGKDADFHIKDFCDEISRRGIVKMFLD